MIWLNKYQPKTLNEVEIDSSVISQLKKNVDKKTPTLIYGPVGSGKTSLIYALANEFNYEIIEINASDTRNAEFVETVVKNATDQQSLFKKGKIILIDEIDNTSGINDRGGIPAILKIIKEVNQSVILTANNPWSSKLKTLKNACDSIEIKSLSDSSVLKILENICDNENVKCEKGALNILTKKSKGDLRAAIIDLQLLSGHAKELKVEHINLLDEREREESIIALTQLILKTNEPTNILDTFDKVEGNFDECGLWLDENLPLEYAGKDLANAYDCLAKSDVFKGRIIRSQYWRLLVYQKILMSVGVALSKKVKNNYFVKYKRPTRILKLYIAKMKNAKRKEMSKILAKETHSSLKKVINHTYPYLKSIIPDETDI